MEPILIQAVGVIIMALVGYGVSLLKKRTDSELGKQALDQVDQIVATVVGCLAQTTAKKMRGEGNGKLTGGQKAELRMTALRTAKKHITSDLFFAAETQVQNLNRYMQDKIEERVGARA